MRIVHTATSTAFITTLLLALACGKTSTSEAVGETPEPSAEGEADDDEEPEPDTGSAGEDEPLSPRTEPGAGEAGGGAFEDGESPGVGGSGVGGSGVGGSGVGGSGVSDGSASGGNAGGVGGSSPGEGASSGGGGSSGAGGASSPRGGCPVPELCSPGPNQACDAQSCAEGPTLADVAGDAAIRDRGVGVMCKWMPDALGPDFACLENEWCFESRECRCGTHGGCQLGERCVQSCEGDDCPELVDYHCEREVACEQENLDECGAQPGQVCLASALQCSEAGSCSVVEGRAALDAGVGEGPSGVGCGEGAEALCCASGEWCFDDVECRCGSGPACDASEVCVLNGIGYYECSGE